MQLTVAYKRSSYTQHMLGQTQVVVDAPQSAARCAQTCFNGGAYILCRLTLKPGAAAPYRVERMSITIPHLGPAIFNTVRVHRNTVRANAAKTRVPCLYPVQPHIATGMNAVQNTALAAMAKDTIERVRHNCQSALLVDQVNRTLHAQTWLNALLYIQGQQMALLRTYFFTDYKVKAVITFCPQIVSVVRTLDHIVVGNRDNI